MCTLQHNLFYTNRYLWYKLSRCWHLILNMLNCNGNRSISIEWYTTCQHLEKCNTHRIDITLRIGKTTSCLFRRSIMNRAHYIRCYRIARCCLCNTKISNLYFSFLRYDNILRLYIPMNNMIIMSRFNSHSNLNCYTDCLLGRKHYLFINIFFQRNTFHQLHYNIMDTILFTYIIHIYNIRMHKSGRSLCFYPKLRNKIFVLRKFLLQNLNRNKTI